MRKNRKGKDTSRLRWPDMNGGQKIVQHPAYLAAIYSKESSPRAVFHAPVYDSQGRLVATTCGRAVVISAGGHRSRIAFAPTISKEECDPEKTLAVLFIFSGSV